VPRIWEALERAEHEQTGQGENAPIVTPERGTRDRSLREKLLAVYQGIESGLPDKDSRVVLFVGANPGEGTSTLVRELAKLVSRELAKRVVLLDAEHGRGGHYEHFGVALEAGLEDVVSGQRQLDEVLQPVNDNTMFLGCLATNEPAASTVAASPRFKELIEQLHPEFDLVLLDAPPVRDSSNALLLTPATDGVVLVVEAEKTRWQVADSLRQRMESQGGNILGVILNKRKFYIPQVIYRRL